MLGPSTAASVKNEVYHQAIAELKKQGKVRFSGAGSHGSRTPGQGEPMEQILLAAVEDGRFDVILLVYNFLQKEPGEKVLEAASKKDLGLTIMKSNPLGRYYDTMNRVEQLKKDGQPIDERLQKSMEQMAETAKQAESFIQKNGLKTPAEVKAAALKFVLADPRVHTLNLAFNTFDDVQNLLALSGQTLGRKDRVLLASYEADCGSLYCRHACGICEADCPSGVPVNTIMRYNHYFEAQGSERYRHGRVRRPGDGQGRRLPDMPGVLREGLPLRRPGPGAPLHSSQPADDALKTSAIITIRHTRYRRPLRGLGDRLRSLR